MRLGMIRDFLRTQNNAVPVARHTGIHFSQHLGTKGRRKNNFTDSVELYSSIEEVLCQG